MVAGDRRALVEASGAITTQHIDPLFTFIQRFAFHHQLLRLSINPKLSLALRNSNYLHHTLCFSAQVQHMIHGLAFLAELEVRARPRRLIAFLIVEHVGLVETLEDTLLVKDALLDDKLWVKP